MRRSWRVELRWSDLVPLAALLLVFVLTVGNLYLRWREIQQARAEGKILRDGIVDAGSLYQALLNAESGQRGYLLTGRASYKEPYEFALRDVENRLQAFDLALNRNPANREVRSAFDRDVRLKLQELSESIRLFDAGQKVAALDIVETDEGLRAMDRVRKVIRESRDKWIEEQNEVIVVLDDLLRQGALTFTMGTSLCLIFMVLATWRLNEGFGSLRQRLTHAQAEERRYHLLANRLQTAGEQERGQMARSIHDTLGQELTAIKIDLTLLAGKLAPDNQELQERLQKTSALADSAIQLVRNLSMELRPAILDQLGLAAALEWQLQEFSERTGLECRLETELDQIPLRQDQQIALFRIAQEALTNVARHAEAQHVSASIRCDENILQLRFSDDGKGMPRDALEDYHSIGLFGMQERARLAGGSLQIDSEPGRGTTLLVSVPVEAVAG